MKQPIDLVIPYVNYTDEEWQQTFIATCEQNNITPAPERWRDMGTLVYLFRGIAQYMPWVRTVHLLVERESQVPKWIDRSKVNIVYHHDIIPSWNLPTYNSQCFELFLHKIKGLSDYFLYGNDDIFPLQPIEPEDFFDKDTMRPKIRAFVSNVSLIDTYTFALHNSERFARRMLESGEVNLDKSFRFGHSINPMCKATWKKIWEFDENAIKGSITTFRDSRNMNQDVHQCYHYLSGNYTRSDRKTMYTNIKDMQKVLDGIRSTDVQMLCINDTAVDNIEQVSMIINFELQKKFPEKCKYEL